MSSRLQVDADKSAGADLSGTQKDMGSFYLQNASLKRAGTYESEQGQRVQDVYDSPARITSNGKRGPLSRLA